MSRIIEVLLPPIRCTVVRVYDDLFKIQFTASASLRTRDPFLGRVDLVQGKFFFLEIKNGAGINAA